MHPLQLPKHQIGYSFALQYFIGVLFFHALYI